MNPSENFKKLLDIMETLRGENGCEWDKKQTHESLKPYMIEEAYEVVNSIDNNDIDELKKELGDVLLQVVFHSQVAKETGEFDINDVITEINEKMIRRHPHVFGDSEGYSYEQWEKLKAQETNEKMSRIGKFKRGMPPLQQLRRLFENSAAVGFDHLYNEDISQLMKNSIDKKDIKSLFEYIIYYCVVNEINPETMMNDTAKEFQSDFEKMEYMLGDSYNNTSKKVKKEIWDRLRGE